MLRSFKIYTCTNGSLGLHLSRAPWDPYPWVSSIQRDSTSYQAGLRTGDCLLELNGQDVLGLKISEIAALLKNHWLNESSNHVTVVIWRNRYNSNGNSGNGSTNECKGSINGVEDDEDDDEDEENNAHNINQQSLQKFATCLQHIAQLLECPVCLEVIKPPGWQCCNGHVLCNNCRNRSEKCPVCRVPLGPRGRCLLSDKLFTLLADSFPCDGVRSNKNSPKDRRKCSTEFHNQPKMTIAQKHQQQQQEKNEQQGVKKAKDFLFTSLRHHRRKISNSKMSHDDNNVEGQTGETKEKNEHPSMQKLAMYDLNTVLASSFKRHSSNRKSTPDYKNDDAFVTADQPKEANVEGVATTFCHDELKRQTSTIQQCHCITCFKSDRVAIVNSVTMTNTTESTTLNKYILRIPSQAQLEEDMIQQKQQQQNEEKFHSFQCPTGKLCCLNVNVLPSATCTRASSNTNLETNNNNETSTTNTPFLEPMTNDSLSTRRTTSAATKQTKAKLKQTSLMTEQQHQLQKHQVNSFKYQKILKNEWEILAHLTEDHKLPVYQYYAEYGQRIPVQCLSQQNSITCLNLRGSDQNVTKAEKFFLACITLEMPNNTTADFKVAIFLYHMNTNINDKTIAANSTCFPTDEVSEFETIIENPLTGIKWFGRAHPLTTPWSHIHEKQHFLRHNVLQNHLVAVSMNEATVSSGDDAFVIVIKKK